MSAIAKRWTFKVKDKIRVAVYYHTGTLVVRGESVSFQGGLYQKVGRYDTEFAALTKLYEMFGVENLVKTETPDDEARDRNDNTPF